MYQKLYSCFLSGAIVLGLAFGPQATTSAFAQSTTPPSQEVPSTPSSPKNSAEGKASATPESPTAQPATPRAGTTDQNIQTGVITSTNDAPAAKSNTGAICPGFSPSAYIRIEGTGGRVTLTWLDQLGALGQAVRRDAPPVRIVSASSFCNELSEPTQRLNISSPLRAWLSGQPAQQPLTIDASAVASLRLRFDGDLGACSEGAKEFSVWLPITSTTTPETAPSTRPPSELCAQSDGFDKCDVKKLCAISAQNVESLLGASMLSQDVNAFIWKTGEAEAAAFRSDLDLNVVENPAGLGQPQKDADDKNGPLNLGMKLVFALIALLIFGGLVFLVFFRPKQQTNPLRKSKKTSSPETVFVSPSSPPSGPLPPQAPNRNPPQAMGSQSQNQWTNQTSGTETKLDDALYQIEELKKELGKAQQEISKLRAEKYELKTAYNNAIGMAPQTPSWNPPAPPASEFGNGPAPATPPVSDRFASPSAGEPAPYNPLPPVLGEAATPPPQSESSEAFPSPLRQNPPPKTPKGIDYTPFIQTLFQGMIDDMSTGEAATIAAFIVKEQEGQSPQTIAINALKVLRDKVRERIARQGASQSSLENRPMLPSEPIEAFIRGMRQAAFLGISTARDVSVKTGDLGLHLGAGETKQVVHLLLPGIVKNTTNEVLVAPILVTR
jgi:hypothetical protein